MKILIALHQCMDLGGIINHTEQLIGGLKDLGHEVDLKEFAYSETALASRKTGEFSIGPSGIPHSQGKGWQWKASDRIPYKNWAALKSALRFIRGYDLVVWTIPVVPKNKTNLGNDGWVKLYSDHEVTQVAFIHDGNLEASYPHIGHILPYLDGLACVHHAALGSTRHIKGIDKELILNPQENPVRNYPDWETKPPGFFNLQTFKAWKHVHELVGAIRYMPLLKAGELREVVGKGIEYQYMTSEEKCKPQYFHPDGVRFWHAAEDNGMHHHEYMEADRVDLWLHQARLLIDPSWSARYSRLGGHYNRVVVDGMIRGCVAVAHVDGMGTDLFLPGEHYVDLSPARDSKDYAEIIAQASHMSDHDASRFRSNCRQLLPLFDRKKVAQNLLDLAEHGECGQGEFTTKLLTERSDNIMFNHFGVI